MNICVVAYKFGTEREIGEHLGTYHYLIEKTRRLVKNGHAVFVVCPWLSVTNKGGSEVSGVKVIRYWPPMLAQTWLLPLHRLMRWIYIRQTRWQVLKLASNRKIDVVYVWQARETGYAVARIKKQLGVPFIFRQITAWRWHFQRTPAEVFANRRWYRTLRSWHLENLADHLLERVLDTRSQRYYAKTIYDNADRVVFLSRAAVSEGEQLGLDPGKAEVLGVAIEHQLFEPLPDKAALRAGLGLPKDKKIILFIGRINFAEKGLGILLDAAPSIFVRIPDAYVVIVGGGGEEARMKERISRLGITDRVCLAGIRPFADLPRYINAADTMVVPSLWMEAFGQVTIEAMSCGLPPITSDAGASPEINLHGKTGMVVPAGNAGKLAEAVIALLQDDGLRMRLGTAARKRVMDEYTYEAVIGKFLKIITV